MQAASDPRLSSSGLVAVVRELATMALLAAGIYLGLHLVIMPVHVEGTSMLHTLEDGDYLVATTIDYRVHPPNRGDIVVLQGTAADPRDLIKRVVGVPGDHLVIRPDATVCVGGRRLDEPYVSSQPAQGGSPVMDVVVPPGEYFVMGDNRGASRDSRSFGPVAASRIEARAWLRLAPLDRVGPADRVEPSLGAGPGC